MPSNPIALSQQDPNINNNGLLTDSQINLLAISNGLRELCDMTGFHNSLTSEGHDWMSSQLQQTINNYSNYCANASPVKASKIPTFNPEDLIKTPARKRAVKALPGAALAKSKASSHGDPFATSTSPDKENMTSPMKGLFETDTERFRSSRSTRANLAPSNLGSSNNNPIPSSKSETTINKSKSEFQNKSSSSTGSKKKIKDDEKKADYSVASNISRSTRSKVEKDSIAKPKNPFGGKDKKDMRKVEKYTDGQDQMMKDSKLDEVDEEEEDSDDGEMEIVIEIPEPQERSKSKSKSSKSKMDSDVKEQSSTEDIGAKSKSKSKIQPSSSSSKLASSSSSKSSSRSFIEKDKAQSSKARKLNESQLSVSRENQELDMGNVPSQSTPHRRKGKKEQGVDVEHPASSVDIQESGKKLEAKMVGNEEIQEDESDEEDQEETQMPEKTKTSSSPKNLSKLQSKDEDSDSEDSSEEEEEKGDEGEKNLPSAAAKLEKSKDLITKKRGEQSQDSSESSSESESDSESESEERNERSKASQKQSMELNNKDDATASSSAKGTEKFKSNFLRKSQRNLEEEKTRKMMAVNSEDEEEEENDEKEIPKKEQVEVKSAIASNPSNAPISEMNPSTQEEVKGRRASKITTQIASKDTKRKSEEAEEESDSKDPSSSSSSKALRSDDGTAPSDGKERMTAPQIARSTITPAASGTAELTKKLEAMKNIKVLPKQPSKIVEKSSTPTTTTNSSAQPQAKKFTSPNSPGSSIPISTSSRSSPHKPRSQISLNFNANHNASSPVRPSVARSESKVNVSQLREKYEHQASPGKAMSPTPLNNGSTTPANSPLPPTRTFAASVNVGGKGLYPSLDSLAGGNVKSSPEKEKKVQEKETQEKETREKEELNEREVMDEKNLKAHRTSLEKDVGQEKANVDEDSEMEDADESPSQKPSSLESGDEKGEMQDAPSSPLASPSEEKEEVTVVIHSKKGDKSKTEEDEEEEVAEDLIMATDIENLDESNQSDSEEEEAEETIRHKAQDDREMVLEELFKKEVKPASQPPDASPSKATRSLAKEKFVPNSTLRPSQAESVQSSSGGGILGKLKNPFSLFGGKPQQSVIPGQTIPRNRVQPPGQGGFIPKQKIPGPGNGDRPQSRMNVMSQSQSTIPIPSGPSSLQQGQGSRPQPSSLASKPNHLVKAEAARKAQQFEAERRAAEKAKMQESLRKKQMGVNPSSNVASNNLKPKMKVKAQDAERERERERERDFEDGKNGKKRKLSHEPEARNGNADHQMQNPNQQSNRPALQTQSSTSSIKKGSLSQKPMHPISAIPRSNTVNQGASSASTGFNPAAQPVKFADQPPKQHQKTFTAVGPSNGKSQIPGKQVQSVNGTSKKDPTFSNQNPFQSQQAQALARQQQQQQLEKQKQKALSSQKQKYEAKEEEDGDDDPNATLPEIASEYSDSDDEGTQRRRAEAPSWCKGDALMRQLELQQDIDADAIFNFPNAHGPVSLDDLMPLPADASSSARQRRREPRSSSAHWTDLEALRQNEVYAYNKAYDIKTGKVLVPTFVGSGIRNPSGNGRGSNNSEASTSKRSPLSQRTDAK